jgi:hypothetical protein
MQYLYFNGYLNFLFKKSETELKERANIEYNNSNQQELDKIFEKIIGERITMLDNMEYSEWLAYNNKNSTIKYNNHEYYLSIYEATDDEKDPEFILRATANKDALNITYSDLMQQEKYAFIFTSFAPNTSLISIMNDLTKNKNGINDVSFYSLDYAINKAVKKHSIVGSWEKSIDKKNSYKGIITVGYIMKDVEKDYSNTYYNYANKYFIVFVSLITFIASVLLHYSKYQISIVKPLSLLIVLNIYLTIYFSTVEGITTFETEQSKFTDINSGVLSLSFLTGVNTYVLDNLSKLKKNKFGLHSETSFYFLFAILLMLASLYKTNNYSNIDNIRTSRIDIQCMYNMCVIINFYVLFNYMIYIGITSQIFKIK